MPHSLARFSLVACATAMRINVEGGDELLAANSDDQKQIDSPYIPANERLLNMGCCQEVGIDQELRPDLPDLGETAHSWCRSDRVPEDKRVPPFLRGLYWLKGYGQFSSIAFCTSLAEWDAETNTAFLPPWFTWVEQRLWDDGVPPATMYTQPAGLTAPPVNPETGRAPDFLETGIEIAPDHPAPVYRLVFDFSDDLIQGDIHSSVAWLNTLADLPLNELAATADGTVHRERQGDIWDRPSYALHLFQVHRYEPVRIVDDEGVIHRERYELMKQEQSQRNASFVYCGWDCPASPARVKEIAATAPSRGWRPAM